MKNYCKKYIGIPFAFFALVVCATAQNSVQSEEKSYDQILMDQSINRIVGAWETIVTPTNCNTGDPVAPPFYGVITFNEGGTVAEFGANPMSPYRTPGHGIWSNEGGRGPYSLKFSFLALNPAGAPIGRIRVSQSLDLSRFSDESTSSGSFVLSNFAGNTLATGCTNSVAVRVH